MTILAEILAHKRIEVARQKAERPLAQVIAAVEAAPPPRDFIGALRRRRQEALPFSHSPAHSHPALIAEIKQRSPSRGLLTPDFDPLGLASIYRANGAACISVLTDEQYFGGSLAHLTAVRRQEPAIPLLRKDFVCDAYQVYQARAAGADAVLLIVAALEPGPLRDLHALSRSLGMAALVETHSAAELDIAMTCAPALVGINNRDLRSFIVDLATTERLAATIPASVCVVAESGIHGPDDVARLAALLRPDTTGVDAILVGEGLVTARDVAAQVRALVGAPHASPRRGEVG